MSNSKTTEATKKLVVLALLSAIGFVSMLFIKIPVIGFLKYEPKDIFLVLAGLMYGPAAAASCVAVTAVLELLQSDTGLIGMAMNIFSSLFFVLPVSILYSRRKDLLSVMIGLLCSVVCQTTAMLLWNYLISPLYMGITRAEITPLLMTMFLPFNLLKSGVNAALSMLLYRPFLRILHLCGYPVGDKLAGKRSTPIIMYIAAGVLFCVCAGVIVWLNAHK